MILCQRLLTSIALVSLLFLASATAMANSKNDPRPTVGVSEYLQILQEFREDLKNGVPRKLSGREMTQFDRIHQQFRELLVDVDDVSELRERDRLRLYNLQEELDTLMIGQRDLQMVCTDRQQLGTRIKRRHCQTAEEQQRDREMSRAWLGDVRYMGKFPEGR